MKNAPPLLNSIRCYMTVGFECGYLPDREAKNLIIDPHLPVTNALFGDLLECGFRRSGQHIYRPHCDGCQACIPVRVPVKQFSPNRSQKRCWRRNQDLTHTRAPAEFNREQFDLYQRYMNSRHGDSGMADSTESQYLEFLSCPGVNTHFYEFRLRRRLVAVAVTDDLPRGLSAVYTYYDPQLEERSLGTFAVLWQIHEARRLGLPWVYLGYWIEACAKMRYKSNFSPLEAYRNSRWSTLES